MTKPSWLRRADGATAPRQRRRPMLEELESRLLYAADAAALPMLLASDAELSAPVAVAPAIPQAIANADIGGTRNDIVFIDTRVPDLQQVLTDLNAASTGRRLEVVLIDAAEDGIGLISRTLAQRGDIDAVHILAHGGQASVQLGASQLDFDALRSRAGEIAAWGRALDAQADLLIYGCNVAAGADGQALVRGMAALTGADVAASDDLSGSSDAGGDVLLEVQTGAIEAANLLGVMVNAKWTGALATFVVTNTGDAGAGTLRQAILDANANAGTDTINFSIGGPSFTGAHVIAPATALPPITGQLTIDASTNPDFASNGARPTVVLDGSGAGGGVDGLTIGASADGSTVRGLGIRGFGGNGILIAAGADNNTIAGNFIGSLDTDGTQVAGDANGQSGVRVLGANNRIGGAAAGDRNVLSANSVAGVTVTGAAATGNTVINNMIGTDLSGATAAGNAQYGVYLFGGASGNVIGGVAAGDGNLISGNAQSGVYINGSSSNLIAGNRIGTNAAGTSALGNGDSGVFVNGASIGNVIGGVGVDARNLISGNTSYGVTLGAASVDATVIQGNYIGTDAAGSAAIANGGWGVVVDFGATNTQIGGTAVGEGNLISGNTNPSSSAASGGIYIWGTDVTVRGNLIGTDYLGVAALPNGNTSVSRVAGILVVDSAANVLIGGDQPGAGNRIANTNGSGIGINISQSATILGNVIVGNQSLGIDRDNDGVSGNTVGGSFNTPVVGSVIAAPASATISYSLNSTANSYFRIEFFANSGADPSGHGEGQRYLGYANARTDATGNVTRAVVLNAALSTGEWVSATATRSDASYAAYSGTSEFSANQAVTATAPFANDDGAALLFDGVDDRVSVPDAPSLNMSNRVTIEAWVQPQPSANIMRIILNKEGEYEIGLRPDGEISWAFANTDPGWAWHDTGYRLTDGQWAHVAVTYDIGVVTTYVNGVVVDVYNGAGALGDAHPALDTLTIGGRTNNPTGQYFAGLIDEVRLFATARSAAEIAADARNPLTGSDPRLVGYWRFDEGAGLAANDSSSKANHGGLAGGPSWAMTASTGEANPLIVTAANGVLGNDFDPDGTAVTVTAVNGSSGAVGNTISLASGALLRLNADGSYDYDPNGAFAALNVGQSAVDKFSYTIADGNGGVASASASIRVTGANTAPSITSDGAGATATRTVVENSTAVTVVTSSDPDGGTPVYSIAGGVDAARFKIDALTGALSFIAAPDFEAPADTGADNIYDVVVRVSDGLGAQATQALAVSVVDQQGALVVTTEADVIDGDVSSIAALMTNRGADGQISLREAMLAANASANDGSADRIGFAIAGAPVGGVHTIALASSLPAITEAVIIDGSTDPHYAGGAPVIVIDGAAAGADAIGFELRSSGSTINALAVQRFNNGQAAGVGTGILIDGNFGASNNTISNNVLRLNSSKGSGVFIGAISVIGAANTNTITGNQVLGNFNDGIRFAATSGAGNVITNNVVSGNGDDGIRVRGSNLIVTGNTVSNNQVNGGPSAGIELDGALNSLIANNTVSGSHIEGGIALIGAPSTGNRIWDNTISGGAGDGMTLAANGAGNSLLRNAVSGNAGLAIDLTNDGVTANDALDLDSGDNDRQNFPQLSSALASGGNTLIQGVLDSAPNSTYRIEFFSNSPAGVDPTGHGEAQTYIGAITVTTDGAGHASFSASLPVPVAPGRAISATATVDLGGGTYGSTSEMAANVIVTTAAPSVVVTPLTALTTTEAGGTAQFSVALSAAPLTNVTLPLGVSNLAEAALSTLSVTFTPANWNVAQVITVTGLQDYVNDGNTGFVVTIQPTLSADPAFNGLDAPDLSLINLAVANAAPSISVPAGGQQVSEDANLVFAAANGNAITLADADAGGNSIRVTLSVVHGTLSLAGTAGLSFISGTGNGDTTMVFSAPVAAINAALEGLRYRPNIDYSGADTLSIVADDLGNTGSGGARSSGRTVNVDVLSVNDAPVGASNTVVTHENVAYVFSAADFGLTDPHDAPANGLAAVRIVGVSGGGSLTYNGVAVVAGQSIAVADLVAGRLVFTPGANADGAGYASFSFHVQDDGGTANGGVDVDLLPRLMRIDVTPIDTAPRLDRLQLALTQGQTVTLSSADVSVTDLDTAADALHVELLGVTAGRFESASRPGVAITQFTMADLLGGTVRFVHDGSAVAPSFSIRLSDDITTLAPRSAQISFTLTGDGSLPVVPGGSNTGGAGVTPIVAPPTSALTPPPAASSNATEQRNDDAANRQPSRAVRDQVGHLGTLGALGTLPGWIDVGERDDVSLRDFVDLLARQNSPAGRGAVTVPSLRIEQQLLQQLRLGKLVDVDDIEAGTELTIAGLQIEVSGRGAPIAQLAEVARPQLEIPNFEVNYANTSAALFTVGLVWWALRAAGILTALVTTLPAWRGVDPLPVLRDGERHANAPSPAEDEMAAHNVV